MAEQVNPEKIHRGLPDQDVSGPILSAPVGSPIPTDINDPISPVCRSPGYVDEDGLTINVSKEFEDLPDWSGELVKRLKTTFGVEATFNCLELNSQSLSLLVGEENIEITPADDTHGTQAKIYVKNVELKRKSFIFLIKDGSFKTRIIFPNAQIVTDDVEVTFKAGEAIKIPVKISAFNDGSGNFAYIYSDDGLLVLTPNDSTE
jgi:hypothetical protein